MAETLEKIQHEILLSTTDFVYLSQHSINKQGGCSFVGM